MERRDEADSDTFEIMQRWQNRWTSIFSRTRYNREENIFSFERGDGILRAYEGYVKRFYIREYARF